MNRFLLDDRWFRRLLVPAIVFLSQVISDSHLLDFWHHLARGREIVRTGVILNHDIFTYTLTDRSLQDVNWLTQIGYEHLFSWGGLAAVQCVNALLLALVFAWLIAVCRRLCGSLEVAMAVGIFVFLACRQCLTIRPQTLSLLFFVALFDVLLRAEKDVRWLFVTPLFQVIWPNVHGAYPAGLLLLGGFTLARGIDTWRTQEFRLSALYWGGATLVGALTTLTNPYGFGIYTYAAGLSAVSAHRGIEEWLPPSWRHPTGALYFVSLPLAAGLFVVAWRAGRKITTREAVLLLIFGLMAARSIRMVPWWMMVLAPALAERIVFLRPRWKQQFYPASLGATLSVLGLLLFCVFSVPPLQAYNPVLQYRTADKTTAHLEKARQRMTEVDGSGNLFARLEWSEYFTWAASPQWKVFIDGRIEIITDKVWDEYSLVTVGGSGWDKVLQKYQVNWLVLDEAFHREKGLLPQVEASKDWTQELGMDNVKVFRRVGRKTSRTDGSPGVTD